MPFYFYVWTPEILEHLAGHDVSPEEFEEVVSNPDYVDVSRSSGNPIAFGWTAAGRYLCCVYKIADDELVEPVTAYDAAE